MMHRPAVVAGLAALLSSGCISAQSRAEHAWSRLKPGMTQGEVVREIGSPSWRHKVKPVPGVESQTVLVWQYNYKGSMIASKEVDAVVQTLAITFAVAAGTILSGSLPLFGIPGGGGGGNSPKQGWGDTT